MKVALFYNRSPGTAGDYFHRALVAAGHAVDQFNTAQADQCRGTYAVYLRIDHGDYMDDLPEAFHPKAFYVIDAHLAKSWRRIREQARRYDLVFCAQRSAAASLRRACWVPLGCDAALHGARALPKRYDVTFVGRDGGVPRKFYLQALRERYPQAWIGTAPHTEMAGLYSQSRIGFHYIECTSPLKDHVSMRVYEVLASGAMLLTNQLAPGAFEDVGLQDRRELVVYRSPQELLALIDHYLAHPEERQRIADAGRRAAIERHTYAHRVAQMMQIVEQHHRG